MRNRTTPNFNAQFEGGESLLVEDTLHHIRLATGQDSVHPDMLRRCYNACIDAHMYLLMMLNQRRPANGGH